MKNKLYRVIDPNIKSCYRTHLFICVEEKSFLGLSTKQFINIKSGTLVDGALWYLGSELEEVKITEEYQLMIDKILKRKKSKSFISQLKNR